MHKSSGLAEHWAQGSYLQIQRWIFKANISPPLAIVSLFVRTLLKSSLPLIFFSGCARTEDQVIELLIKLEYNFP